MVDWDRPEEHRPIVPTQADATQKCFHHAVVLSNLLIWWYLALWFSTVAWGLRFRSWTQLLPLERGYHFTGLQTWEGKPEPGWVWSFLASTAFTLIFSEKWRADVLNKSICFVILDTVHFRLHSSSWLRRPTTTNTSITKEVGNLESGSLSWHIFWIMCLHVWWKYQIIWIAYATCTYP